MTDDATGVVLAAAGLGSRCEVPGGTRKQFLELAGRPLIHYSLDVFAALKEVSRIVITIPQQSLKLGDDIVAKWWESGAARASRPPLSVDVVAGGEYRCDSVLKGLEFLAGKVRWTLVHDAARPLLLLDDARRVLDAVKEHGAAAIGYPSTDSVKRVEQGWVVLGLRREEVWMVQTPQGAVLDSILEAYKAARSVANVCRNQWTDEALVLKLHGVPVRVVKGSASNMKITFEGDVPLAERILRDRSHASGREL